MKPKGFTLIELLVVVAIIGILATIIITSLNTARAKARDAKRLMSVDHIQTALEMYLLDRDRYPSPISSNGSWEISNEDNGDFLDDLLDYNYMSKVPVDPINSHPHTFYYYRYAAGSYGCDTYLGAYYVLAVRKFEDSPSPHPKSPGWRCPSRNWQNEFQWVTGKFENA